MNGGGTQGSRWGGSALWTGQWTIGGRGLSPGSHQFYLWNPARQPTGTDLKSLISGTGWWTGATLKIREDCWVPPPLVRGRGGGSGIWEGLLDAQAL